MLKFNNFGKNLVLGCSFILAVILVACGDTTDKSSDGSTIIKEEQDHYIEKGDWDAIKQRGSLRILVPQFNTQEDRLPRKGFPVQYELEALSLFAQQMDLEPSLVYVADFSEILDMLLAGKGDVIAANMTITKERLERIQFTLALKIVREQIVVSADSAIKDLKDLKGKSVAVQKSTSYLGTMQGINQTHPEIGLNIVSDDVTMLSILDGVEDGVYDAAIIDSNIIESVLAYNEKLKVATEVSDDRAIAWGIRPDAVKLKASLDKFIAKQHFQIEEYPIYKSDLPEIQQRKTLRVLTRNNAATYFLWRGELLGFEYELAHEFAKQQGLRLEMVVAPSRQALYEWLIQGKGDLIAASTTINPNTQNSAITYSDRIKKASEIVVARASDKNVNKAEDLAGRTVHVRRSSAYWRSLTQLINTGVALKLEDVPEGLETEEIIAKVASGEYDLTVSDSHILDIELTWRDDIQAAFPLGDVISHGWVVRKEDEKLLAAINAFIKKEYRGSFYNITHRKYFEKPRTIRKRLTQRVDGAGSGQLSPYDDIVKKYAQNYDFDWRLITAQMYQESRFDPNAKSWAGAKGLMQVMPVVAKQLKIKDLVDPNSGIEAGVRYMDWLRNRFESELLANEHMWFILASYNAGIGHVRDARRLAKQQGWKNSVWFDNVERAMLLLSKREYASKARHGYVRGSEPVKYVREIRNRFKAYIQLTGQAGNHVPPQQQIQSLAVSNLN